jgi:cation:H+ antiporter
MQKLPSLKELSRSVAPAFLFLFVVEPLTKSSPWSALWTVPCVLLASIVITWGAESAQFFVAQGFALAILAWMQTLPEFAVEAVLAWRQQTSLLLAGLTGALRLLTGLAWPMIYVTAAVVHRKSTGSPLRNIQLDTHHSAEVISLLFPLAYAMVIWWKASLAVHDGAVLIVMYVVYLFILTRLPPQGHEEIDELEVVPRTIVKAPRIQRIAAIFGCFLIGGALIYFTAAPFLGSLAALAGAIGIPTFIIIQWLAPIISEFPELLSTFYFARKEGEAAVALMNIASSNINQWTLLFAMLPIVFSMSRHEISAIPLDAQQQTELLLTIGQSLVASVFLINMEFAWLEAAAMFGLFAAQFVLPAIVGEQAKLWIAIAFFVWAGIAVLIMLYKRRLPAAFSAFGEMWHEHVSR